MTTSDKRKITIYCNKIKNGYLRRSERLEEETEESDVSDSESEQDYESDSVESADKESDDES